MLDVEQSVRVFRRDDTHTRRAKRAGRYDQSTREYNEDAAMVRVLRLANNGPPTSRPKQIKRIEPQTISIERGIRSRRFERRVDDEASTRVAVIGR